jgi:hypothetical protein
MNLTLYKDLRKKVKKTLRRLNFIDSNIHRRAIIWDKICPKCKNFIYGNSDFCTCGYSAVREKTVKLWGIIAFTWFFIIVFACFMFSSFSQIHSIVYKKLEKNNSDFYSLSPANVQIITSLRYSKYRDYIQTIYVNPKAKHRLMVLIKPVYWDMLPSKEKEILKQTILRKWSEIYQSTTPDSKFKPEVSLANFK